MSATGTKLLPRDRTIGPLDIVIGVMAFLAALALGASLVAERASEGWRAGLADRLTVQILVPETAHAATALERETSAALSAVRETVGVAHAAVLGDAEMQTLIEPWLGKGALVADLPMPKLIDVTVVPGATLDLAGLASRLKTVAPHAQLDDHRRWIARLKRLSAAVAWSGYGILLLIGIATAATVAFATRAGLEAQHEMVALLHQMGAHARFIARAFERHYALAALVSSTIGAVLAALLFLGAGGLEAAGVEPVPFLPPMALSPAETLWLAAVPLVATAIAWATARLAVLGAVRQIY